MTKEFLYRIKDFRQKCNTNFNFLLIFIVVLGGYVCIRSSYEFVIFSISIISLGITVGFVYINTVKNKMLVKKISNIKKIYFLSLIIGVVIVLVILTLLKKDNMEEVFFLLSLRATLEYTQVENIFNVENKYISNIGIHIIAIVLYVLITLINLKNISIEAIFSDLKLKEIAYISISINLCMALSTLRKMLSNRKKISENEFKRVILYITSIMFNLSGLIFIKLDLNIISKALLILKCTTFTLFYGYMIDKIRYECFNIINSNIEQAIKEKKYLNSILLKRNKILNDINIMINRTQNNYSMLLDSIYGGVFLFVGNKLQHVNNTMIKKMNMKSSDFVGMDIGVFCDKDFITRIVLNLLSNSVKYGKKGGLIKINLALEDDKVCIKIKNDGPKIEKDIMPHIFDRFTKLNKAFNRIKEGSGLGLFMTKALVEIQGGSIGLISNNEGNEFVITMNYLDNVEKEQIQYENFEMNSIDEKVDIEFSDIYIT